MDSVCGVEFVLAGGYSTKGSPRGWENRWEIEFRVLAGWNRVYEIVDAFIDGGKVDSRTGAELCKRWMWMVGYLLCMQVHNARTDPSGTTNGKETPPWDWKLCWGGGLDGGFGRLRMTEASTGGTE